MCNRMKVYFRHFLFQHATKYYIVYDVDMNHSHKTLTIQSPLQVSIMFYETDFLSVLILVKSVSSNSAIGMTMCILGFVTAQGPKMK